MPYLPTSASPPLRQSNANNNNHQSPAANARSSKENITISSHGDDDDIAQRQRSSPRKTREHATTTASSGRLIVSHPKTNNAASSGRSPPKPKPVFKMKRTGHSGPSPFSAKPGPKATSSSSTDILTKSLRSESVVTAKSGHAGAAHAKSGLSGKHRDGDGNLNGTTSRTPLSKISAGANYNPPPRPTTTSASTSTQNSAQKSKSKIQPKQEPESDIIPMGDIQDADLIKAQLAMDALGATRAERSKTQAPAKELPAIDSTSEALDMSAYKVWKDDATGKLLLTCGALLPPGYEKSDHPDLPWVCPVRSCRVLLPGLQGLGRHFGVTHRACRLNDNLDGTLTDLGRYADPAPGDGRKFSGTTKSCIIVSKKYMSLEESPMVKPKPYTHHAINKIKPVQETPKRELRRRSQVDGAGGIQASAMSDDELNPHSEVKGAVVSSGQGPTGKILTKAKSGRPYDMWPDDRGVLKDLFGVLLPDEWALYTQHPTHQWICPVRSCRCLYSARSHLANHFKMRYYGCRFNDNLDGTFTIVNRPPSLPLEQLRIDYHKNPPAVISRRRMDTEPLAEPQISQNFINRKLREHRRGKSSSASSSFAESISKDSKCLPERSNTKLATSLAGNGPVISSAVGFDKDTDDRPYTHWLNPQNNRFQVTRGLIPEGYQLEHQAYPDRPWICPIRSCRFLSRTQAAYSNHWTLRHPNVCVNDNQDGTFSIVEGQSKNGPRVVSRRPMGYDESPLREAQLPVKEREQADPIISTDDDGDQQKKAHRKRSFNETIEAEEGLGDGDPEGLRRYITSQIGGNFPDVEDKELELLLSLSRRRKLKLKHPIPVTHTLTLKQLASVVAQLVGRESPNPCTACRRLAGPFNGCVTLLPDVSVKLSRLVSSSYRNTCANCLYDHTYNACSIKKLSKLQEGLATGTPVALTGGVGGDEAGEEAVDEAGHDTEDEADEEEEETYEYDEQLGATVIRRSQRLPSIPVAEESGVDLDGSPPPRKVITFKDPSPASVSASLDAAEEEQEHEDVEYRRASKRLRTREQSALSASIQATNAATRSLLVSQEYLATETWERGSRGVLPNRRQPSENLVYASAYLTANQTVQIGKTTTFTSLTITSGNTHRLPTDRYRTQSCSLLSGKLRVTLNDGENEFIVGPRGMFTVSPGTTCMLENRNYMDATVHVTAVADR